MIRTRQDWEVIASDAAHMALWYADEARNPQAAGLRKKADMARSSAWVAVSNAVREALRLEGCNAQRSSRR